jgi:serine/threonine protein kinase/tetratricopeptide (TPR) repeat protein
MRERDIFIEVLQKANPAERSAYLVAACAGDDTLHQRVLQLLAQHEKDESFLLDSPPPLLAEMQTVTPELAARETAGTVIGPYQLVEPIGEGGMGTVWMAQQTQPVRRLVAVKLIKAGMDSRLVIARFEAERQALALMDHPNIARVLDGGTTGAGRPYFVMDRVKGVPITTYCDAHRLTARQRLELFVPVCQAVQHAHQKGIIHRDLKPSNVLVALHDGRPVPKVIDFGVAKAAGQTLTDRTLITGLGAIVGTLEYMSPEQAGFNQLDIDTRSDIYSLGALLYELLTGSPPFSRTELTQAGMLEILRVIREDEPTKPSTKLSTAEGLPTLAANRGTEPTKLTKQVRGELDWIVMKALEKDRNRRYETANGFARDVQHYLADEPVLACPPSAAYRLRKFIRRNRRAVATTAVVLLVVLGGIVGTTYGLVRAHQAQRQEAEQRRSAEQERDEKEQARKEALAHLQTGRQSMERILEKISKDGIGLEPRLEGLFRSLLEEVTTFYQELASTCGDNRKLRADLALAYCRLGKAHERIGEKEQAVRALRQAIAMYERAASERPLPPDQVEQLISAYRHLGWALADLGRRDERVSAHERAFAYAERLAADRPTDERYQMVLADSCTILGGAWKLTRPQESERLFSRAIGLLSQGGGNLHYLGTAHLALGELLVDEGRLPEAEAALRQSVTLYRKVVAQDARFWQAWDRLCDAYVRLGRLLAVKGVTSEAEQLLREAVAIGEKQRAAFPLVSRYRDQLILCYAALSQLLAAWGRTADCRELMGKLSSLVPEGATASNELAWLLANCAEKSLRDPRRAVQWARQAVDLTPQFAAYWRTLGVAYYRAGDNTAAVAALERASELRGNNRGEDAVVCFFQAMAHARLGHTDRAQSSYDQGSEWALGHQPNDPELRDLRAEAARELQGTRR